MKRYIVIVLSLAITSDIIGFMFWILSNQQPADGFYIGALTAKLLAIIFN